MAHRDRSPVHVPLRTSSRNPLRDGTTMDDSQEDVTFVERKASKASRILGTDLPLYNGPGSWNESKKARRPSHLSTPDNTSRKNSLLPSTKDAGPPSQNLRVRASSPLLGQEYRSHEPTPPLPRPSKKVHHSGSSSTLFSYFRSRDSSAKSAPGSSQGLQPSVRNQLQAEPQVTYQQPQVMYQQPQGPTKESKRKNRPSRLDLSMLFPKPRNPAPPLLSPQRMTNSPSPVSVASDFSTVKPDRGRSNSGARKLAAAPPPRASVVKKDPSQQPVDSDLSSIPEKKNGEWWEQPFERLVGTNEIDLALDRYAGRRSLLSRSSMISNSREQLRSPRQRTPERARNPGRAQSPPSSRTKSPGHLIPNPGPDPVRRVMSPQAETVRRDGRDGFDGARSDKSSVTKKGSKNTLKHRNLQDSSVLCLSSEDEEDEDTPTMEHPPNEPKSCRDSVATYGDVEPEIFIASTAQATLSPTLRRFERAPSTSSHGSHQTPRAQSTGRSPSTASSASKLSHNGPRTQRSSGIPTIAEPDVVDQFPKQPLLSPQQLKEMNRRSRVIAVTRQEQQLLESMRQRKGKITPSVLNLNPDAEPDRSSMVSAQTRDSFCGSDTSFLRLSATFPPSHAQTDQGATHTDKHGSLSQSCSSDLEQKTVQSPIASPPFSTGYSESLPSPATTSTSRSPITPTLPIHRFSPLPSPKPPPSHPPPAIPEEQKQHTRRRTDSSEAIMLDDNGDPRGKHEFLSFDFDWNHDRASVAAVH